MSFNVYGLTEVCGNYLVDFILCKYSFTCSVQHIWYNTFSIMLTCFDYSLIVNIVVGSVQFITEYRLCM